MIEHLERSYILEMCKRLGHDPTRVARINIEPTTIEVIYFHPITDQVNPEDLQARVPETYEETKES